MSGEQPKWFEKTVEYAFVRRFADFLACPLDGKLETMGDVLFGLGDNFFLVEFKKDDAPSSVSSERNKYADAEASIEILQANPLSSCHWTVFGVLENNRFSLVMQHYPDFLSHHSGSMKHDVSKSRLVGSAINYENFCRYLEIVIKEKLKGKEGDGGGIAAAVSDMLVVNDKGATASVIEAVSALELERKLQLRQRLQQEQERTQKQTRGHSPGMGGR